jgi:hypothetical protein
MVKKKGRRKKANGPRVTRLILGDYEGDRSQGADENEKDFHVALVRDSSHLNSILYQFALSRGQCSPNTPGGGELQKFSSILIQAKFHQEAWYSGPPAVGTTMIIISG